MSIYLSISMYLPHIHHVPRATQEHAECPLLHGANFPHMPKVRPENLFDKLKSQWSGLQSHGGTKLERRHNPQMHGRPITLWASNSNSCGLATWRRKPEMNPSRCGPTVSHVQSTGRNCTIGHYYNNKNVALQASRIWLLPPFLFQYTAFHTCSVPLC